MFMQEVKEALFAGFLGVILGAVIIYATMPETPPNKVNTSTAKVELLEDGCYYIVDDTPKFKVKLVNSLGKEWCPDE